MSARRRGRIRGAGHSVTSKNPIPAQICEFGFVGVEHVLAQVGKAQFAYSALTLGLDDRVREFAGLEACSGRVVVEEVSV